MLQNKVQDILCIIRVEYPAQRVLIFLAFLYTLHHEDLYPFKVNNDVPPFLSNPPSFCSCGEIKFLSSAQDQFC